MIGGEEIILNYLIFKKAVIIIAIIPPLISSFIINIIINFIVFLIIVAFAPYLTY